MTVILGDLSPSATRTAIEANTIEFLLALGYHGGVLSASPMGYGVHRRRGFADHCSLGVYEWQPTAE